MVSTQPCIHGKWFPTCATCIHEREIEIVRGDGRRAGLESAASEIERWAALLESHRCEQPDDLCPRPGEAERLRALAKAVRGLKP